MMKKFIVLTILLSAIFSISTAQNSKTFHFPATSASVVAGFYHELSEKPPGIPRSKHAATVFEKYFSNTYVEQGGKGNKVQTFEDFKAFVVGTFSQLPNLNVALEELVAVGNKVTVKIKLSDKAAGVEINYLALYHVENGKIQNRYAYSDGGF